MNLARIVATWLGTTTHNKVFISKRSDGCYDLKLTAKSKYRYNYDRHIGVIGDTWVVIPPGVALEAADPEFFGKLENIIKDAELEAHKYSI